VTRARQPPGLMNQPCVQVGVFHPKEI
jgi:hypothetical protein